jgi:DNA-binding beta-propeller fold protein YncE
MKYFLFVFYTLFLLSCVKPYYAEDVSQFPPNVQIIFTNKCATAGCHNNKSFENAGGLNLTSWSTLFQGGVNGSVAIPFAVPHSPLFSFVNTFSDEGLQSIPTMPINQEVLDRDEVKAIKQWIDMGCPNASGQIPFATNPQSRAKVYITNQGCDVVTVVDAETGLAMRYVEVGKTSAIESPHGIRVSDDGKYWYVCFTNGTHLQKFDAVSDTLVAEANITAGSWNVIRLSQNGKTAYVSDLNNNGRIAVVNTETMMLQTMYASGLFNNPHGIVVHPTNNNLYISAQYGNTIYKFNPSIPLLNSISLEKGKPPVLTSNLIDPHELMLHPSMSQFMFVSCQASNEVRVLDLNADTLYKVIPVGKYPLEMAISKKKNLLFVTCQEDPNPTYPAFLGSVYVIDINTMQVVSIIREKFYQPHGVGVDDKNDKLFVVSRNATTDGPAPHHTSACGGRNGYFHTLDLQTFKPVRPSAELSVDPYSADVRVP